ncbi:MAG TPA: pyruvate carboxylase [Bryobacteraceae bacterium]|nr:pyruvate carboxylase [Bryobacteraceae bacterium]
MKKLLALNRGEIAIRIFRAANELGLRTVAVYSQEDRLSLHRFKADEAFLIGDGSGGRKALGPVQAYLDVEGIVALAKDKGVDFIHPGYGFLSENPALPRACEAAGITFIGPSAEILDLLGDKTAARRLAEKAGIPVIPGTERPVVKIGDAEKAAQRIGFPLIIKAAFGGGGRGMRVVDKPAQLKQFLEEATAEAAAAFGNGAVFLERFIRRPRHIEVQVLGDRHGNILHLYERDCSVQRRHQKVVEVAPAVSLAPGLRDQITSAAVRLCKAANYYGAGTVEFLLDSGTNEWFFIEVNPRVQVEHTVTEVVTGIDIVRTQILIACGERLDGVEINIPSQESVTLHGHALQCRITTEDPANNFVPDYGKIHTYRSPAGFGIRLDGASAYGGAVITPYYDSLLVKITAWGRNFPQACQRMDRALREFRIRGVKTNIPFLENVVNDPTFISGNVTTRFLDENSQLFRFKARRDRATKLLTYIAEVSVNGNPEVAGKPAPAQFRKAPIPEFDILPAGPPRGTRNLLLEKGPEALAEWMRSEKRLLLTDTTFRDAHQSLMATRMRTYDMLAIAPYVAQHLSQLFSLEMWGGATFDVAMRFLHEDPFERLRKLREAIPNICFQMLLRASNAVGYTAYPDNVVREFITESAAQGIDIFRVFDSLNWLPNMKVPMDAVRKTNRVCEAAVCYTGDILDPKRDKYPLTYYVKMALELERMGAHILAIKDMAGLLKPFAAARLVKALREATGLPIHFHTHDTSGIASASYVQASASGVDAVDCAISSMSGTTSQPNLNSIVAAFENTPRATGLDPVALQKCADYWETVRAWYAPFDEAPKSGTAEVYLHEMPGGQYTNLKAQAESMGLGERWPEIARMYAGVNMAFGDIVKVTPSSKVVGDMALFLISHGMTLDEFLNMGPNHSVNIPNSVVEMFQGSLGEPAGGWPKKISQVILKGAKPQKGRASERMVPADMRQVAATVEKKLGHKPTSSDLMCYLMYPEVYSKFARNQSAWGGVDVLPTPQFFYGMKNGDEISVDIEPGKTLIVKFLTIGEPHPDGTRTVFFELNGQPREVTIRDKSLEVQASTSVKADPAIPGQVGAPIPGAVSGIAVEPGSKVAKGDKLLIMEAMKMQTTIAAPIAGKVTKVLVHPGQSVEPKDLLLIIE